MPKTDQDLSQEMEDFAADRVEALKEERLAGFVLKAKSPSCGMSRVKRYHDERPPDRSGVGLFASALAERIPALPLEEEGRLHDPRIRENFVTRIFAYGRWLELESRGITTRRLMHFHQRHKLQLMARSAAGTKRLGNLLGTAAKDVCVQTLAERYLTLFTTVMRRIPSVPGHTNVLQHVQGYVSKHITDDDRGHLTGLIGSYRQGLVPLIVPITMLNHHVRHVGVPYMDDQLYLSPHPNQMMLLNHV
jgi:uncharacterized protein YbgA (DUF1722 family)